MALQSKPALAGKLVLVTGGVGLVGSCLVRRLLAEGAAVRATWHRAKPSLMNNQIEYISCDLTRREDCVRATHDVQYVFHCAAKSSGAAATDSSPVADVSTNILINTQMLDAAHRAGVRKFLWLGSTTAYPPTGSAPVKEEDLLTGEPYEKYFCVGWEKRMMEILCRMYGQHLPAPMTVIVLRPTNIYGPNDEFDPSRSRVTAALIRKVVERQNPLEVWGTGEDVRDQIYVDDVVDAMVLAIQKVDGYETLNIGSGHGYSVTQILDTILEIDNHADAKIVFNSTKPSMIPIRLVDITKARVLLGFNAETPLRQGLEKTIDWFRRNRQELGDSLDVVAGQ